MHDDVGARWRSPGPWRVSVQLRVSPLPGLLPHWRVRLGLRSDRVASADAALRLAHRRLHDGHRRAGFLALLADAFDVRRELAILDRAGRCAWRGEGIAALRDAAREAVGWGPNPPTPTSAPDGASPGQAGLSLPQRRVVEHAGGPALVVAVAGAGKTTTMVARVAALVAAGTPPARVLVTSFSRAAVADVHAKLLGQGDARLAQVEVRTFHSLAYALLREAAAGPPGATSAQPSPPPERVAARVLELTLTRLSERGDALAGSLGDLDPDAFLAYRARCLATLSLGDPDALGLPPAARRRLRHAPADPEQPLHRPLLRACEQLRRELGWHDYDDLIVDAWALLARDDAVRRRVAGRWSHRIVDECQDVNPAQVALLESLLDEAREVMLIGDDDQSIYGFRGSDPQLLFELGERLGARTYLLDRNYRARPEPLAAAAALLRRAPGRPQKRVRAARPRGGVVTLDSADGPEHEALLAVSRLRAARADGIRWGSQAVLLRRFAQAPALELALLRAGVPYAVVGAPDALSHALCRAALAGLHLVAVADAPVATRARAWLRWLRGLGLPHGQASAYAARLAATGAGDAWAIESVAGRPPPDAARARAATGRVRVASERGAAAALVAAERELLPWPRHGTAAATLGVLRTATTEGVLAPVGATAAELLVSLAHRRRDGRAERDRVLLTSAHRSKGLEWDVVLVPGQNLGVFPQHDDAEERRLGYVAWTRARERLHLLRDGGGPASPFLLDADLDGLVALQRDLAWHDAGVGRGSAAAAWARTEAVRRFDHEGAGTTDPREDAAPVLGFGHVERRVHTWHGSRSRTRAARGTRAA